MKTLKKVQNRLEVGSILNTTHMWGVIKIISMSGVGHQNRMSCYHVEQVTDNRGRASGKRFDLHKSHIANWGTGMQEII